MTGGNDTTHQNLALDGLISPLANNHQVRRAAPAWSGTTGSLVLSDSMLNTNKGWGAGILQEMANVIHAYSAAPEISIITRPQIGDHQPQDWIDSLIGHTQALVVTAGDCATCTSRALRECVLAEEAGIAATAIVPSALANITTATLDRWGRPDLRVSYLDAVLFLLTPATLPQAVHPAAVAAHRYLIDR